MPQSPLPPRVKSVFFPLLFGPLGPSGEKKQTAWGLRSRHGRGEGGSRCSATSRGGRGRAPGNVTRRGWAKRHANMDDKSRTLILCPASAGRRSYPRQARRAAHRVACLADGRPRSERAGRATCGPPRAVGGVQPGARHTLVTFETTNQRQRRQITHELAPIRSAGHRKTGQNWPTCYRTLTIRLQESLLLACVIHSW